MRNVLCVVGIVGLTACGGGDDAAEPEHASTAGGEDASNQNAPPPEAYATPSPLRGFGDEPARSRTSHEQPLMACGPADSYRRVAEHQCADGRAPLGGDPGLGAQARVGNVGPNATGHIIDLYRVPCPEGDVEIYVDMYGCPEMQRFLVP
ncbi:MAG: hypothetical protein KF729_30180 [Sandaracinaceae bacterium]|nr:hypothetical protein [Sandaracinaceae bacterium]